VTSGGDDISDQVVGPVDYAVGLGADTAFVPGKVFRCSYWGTVSDGGFGWVSRTQQDCEPSAVSETEVSCRCGAGEADTLMTSGLVVQTDSVCAQSSSCGACTASPQCGWCNGNGQCVEGNELGPFDSEGCNGWVQAKCPVEDITLTTSTVVEGSVYGDGSTEITDFAVDDPNAENDAYTSGSSRWGVQGVHLNPLGLFLCASVPYIWRVLRAIRPS
jgi:hypothetical protein